MSLVDFPDEGPLLPQGFAQGFRDGDVFDLGGGVRVEVVHTPGHTRGHCAFHIEPAERLSEVEPGRYRAVD